MDASDPSTPRRVVLPAPVAKAVVGLVVLLVSALVLASVLGGAAPVAAPPGIPDAGRWTGWSLRLAEVAAVVAAVLTTGSLLVAAVLVDTVPVDTVPVEAVPVDAVPVDAEDGPGGALGEEAARAVRAAARSADAWALASLATAVLVAADTRGVPLSRLLGDEPLRVLLDAPGTTRAHLLAAAVAAVAATLATRAASSRSRRTARVATVVALLGLLPPVLAGHAGAVADQDVVAPGLVVHVLAAAVWVGGLVGLLVHLRRSPGLRVVAVARFSRLAGGAYAALAVSGAAAAVVTLPTRTAWASGYGAVVLAKVALLALLGWCGHLHRRRLVRDPAYGARSGFVRLAVVEVALMAVAGGLAAALSRTPLPAVPVAPDHGTGHPGLPGVVEPVSLLRLVGEVRPNPLALLVVAGLLVAHREAVRRVVAAGEAWPRERDRAAVAAAVLAVVVLCSGLATYAPAMVSVQVLQLLLALLVVPAVVVRAAPVRLWRLVRSDPRPADPVREPAYAADPVVGALAVGGLLVALYRTPLLELSQRSHWLHLAVLLAAAGVGVLHLSSVVAPAGGPPPAAGDARARAVLAVPAVCLGVLGGQLLLGDRLVAGRWFLELRWGWVDPTADQRVAGLLALVAAVLLLAVVLVVPGTAQRGGHSRSSTVPSRSSAGTGP